MQGRLLEAENGPAGGDEFNIVLSGRHYGWPAVSNGSDYDGRDIPDHAAGEGFEPPVVTWTPVIAPSDMIVYTGAAFASWRGDGIVSGLASLDRAGTGCAIWVLEDGATGRLRKLAPVPL